MQRRRLTVHAADKDGMSLLAVEGIIARTEDIALEHVASTGTDAVEAVIRDQPDILLMETQIEDVDSLTATRQIRAASPETKVVFLSTLHTAKTINTAYAAGADSYLAKQSIVHDLSPALRLVHLGHQIFSTASDRQRLSPPQISSGRLEEKIIRKCGHRTKSILIGIAQGLTNTEIATAIHVSEGTVKAEIARLNARLNAANRVQLAVLATQAGLLVDS